MVLVALYIIITLAISIMVFTSSIAFAGSIDNSTLKELPKNLIKTKLTENNSLNQTINKSEGITTKVKVDTSQANDNFTLVAAGDWACNEHSKSTVKDIENKNPDLVISTGDMSYEKGATCFNDIVKPISQKLKISLGNHDMEEDGTKELQESYFSHYNLSQSFYSFNYKNTHFIILDSYIEPTTSSEQYQFVKKDLENSSKSSNIDWIIVALHEPFYTNPGRHPPHTEFANIYHPLFDQYGVDLVLAGHNHWYERTVPLKYNPMDVSDPIVKHSEEMKINNDLTYKSNKKKNEIVSFATISNTLLNSTIQDSDNPVFITVGTAGQKQHYQKDYLSYIPSKWDHGFGYLKLEINKNSVKGNFYANEIADREGKNIIEPNYIERDSFILLKEK
ncbi:MAG: metallophosphoesterase [Nitrososphaerales archaeon]